MTGAARFSPPAVEVIAGLGVAAQLERVLAERGLRELAVVCDAGVASAGLLDGLTGSLREARAASSTLVDPDPTVADVEAAAAAAREAGVDGVLAVGGGSGLTAGKAVALRLGGEAPLPTVAVPTTAGSGSEVSDVIVLREPGRPAPVIMRGTGYAPDVALLDGLLLRSLPREPLVDAALDALSHALEALWTNGASAFTDALAFAAADAIRSALPDAIDGAPEALQRLLEASAMANLACGSTGLGLVHALSLATAVPLPHGHLNGVLLPWVAAFTRPAVRPAVAAEIDALAPLYERIGFAARLAVDDAAARQMVDVALASPLAANHVRGADADDLRRILAQAIDDRDTEQELMT